MQQIVVEVEDKAKAKMLLELLRALDFVHLVKTIEKEYVDVKTTGSKETSDFFSLAGLWADRDVSLESIRQKAWPRKYRYDTM